MDVRGTFSRVGQLHLDLETLTFQAECWLDDCPDAHTSLSVARRYVETAESFLNSFGRDRNQDYLDAAAEAAATAERFLSEGRELLFTAVPALAMVA